MYMYFEYYVCFKYFCVFRIDMILLFGYFIIKLYIIRNFIDFIQCVGYRNKRKIRKEEKKIQYIMKII